MTQRMHRFSTPEQASNFIDSYTTITCESRESTEHSNEGVTVLTATPVPATLDVADEIAQVDQVATLPVGVDIFSRTVLIRAGTDVLKLVYFTLEADDLGPVSERLIDASIDSLGY
ncbi:MAG: hypothetical protein OEV40_04390 [Acidimicrobiia bacterium]|nr:hypothetical protein [Acidimicrobiia bacterium]